MGEYYIARVTTRGQITVPAEVRASLQTGEGDYLVFEKAADYFVVKKAALTASQEFENFARPIRERFEKSGLTGSDLEEAIRWARETKNGPQKS